MIDVASAADAPSAPFPGIKPFSYRYRHVFFARQAEIRSLMRLVILYRGVLVYGASQRGKSSLINAGLIPEAIANGYQPERIRVQARRGAECVVDRIAVTKGPSPTYLPSLFDTSGAGEVIVLSLRELIDRVRAAGTVGAGDAGDEPAPAAEQKPALKPLLIFDQFEEWITAFEEAQTKGDVQAAQIQADILREITALINDHHVRVKVVLAFREDYLPRLDPFFGECPTLSDHYLRLGPLSPKRLYKLIRGPFMKYRARYRPEISPALARTIQRQFLASDAAEVSLTELQIVCRSLFEEPALASMLHPGGAGLRGILQQYFRTRLDRLPEAHREPAIALLSCLVSGAGTRKTVDRENLLAIAAADTPAERELYAAALLELEQQARLVRREWRRDLDYFEISSEFLVDWIKEQAVARQHRAEQRRLIAERERAQAQAAEMRARLEEQTKRVAAEIAANEATRARLSAEMTAAKAQAAAHAKQRLVRWTAYAAFVFLVLFVIALAATNAALGLGREHVSRLWVQAATTQLERDPQLSTLLAMRAVDTAQRHAGSMLPAAHMALTRAVRAAAPLSASEDVQGSRATFSADGTTLAFIAKDARSIEIRRGPRFEQRSVVAAAEGKTIAGLLFMKGSDTVVAIYPDGSLERIDQRTSRRTVSLSSPRPAAGESAPLSSGPARQVNAWAADIERDRVLILSSAAPQLRPDGTWLPATQWVSLADVRNGTWVMDQPAGSPGAEVALSDNGRRYGVISAAGDVRVVETDGAVAGSHRFDAKSSICLSADGAFVLGIPRGSEEAARVLLWSVTSNRFWTIPLPGVGAIRTTFFAPDGKTFAVVQTPGIAQIWSTEDQRPLYESPIAATDIVFAPDSSEVFSWGANDVAELWQMSPPRRRLRLAGQDESILTAALSPNGGPILTMTASKLRWWSRNSEDVLIRAAEGDRPVDVALSPDGTTVLIAATSTTADTQIGETSVRSSESAGVTTRLTLSNVSNGTRLAELAVPGTMRALSYSPNGSFIAAGFNDGTLLLLRPGADRSHDKEFESRLGPVCAIAFAADGRFVAYAVQKAANAALVMMRDTATGRLTFEREVPAQVTSLAIAFDSRSIGVGVIEHQTYAYGSASGDLKRRIERLVVSESQTVRQSSPDARRAGVSSGQPSRPDGAPVWSQPAGAPSNAGTAPRDGAGADSVDVYRGTAIGQGLHFAVGAEADGQLVRWNALNERQVLSFSDQARVVAIASHGGHFAVGSYSGLTKLYTADGLLEPVVLQESGPPVLALAFSARGNRVASLGADGVVTLYTFDLDTLLGKGRQIVGKRRLTDAECGQYSLDRVTCDGNRLTWSVVMRKILPLKER